MSEVIQIQFGSIKQPRLETIGFAPILSDNIRQIVKSITPPECFKPLGIFKRVPDKNGRPYSDLLFKVLTGQSELAARDMTPNHAKLITEALKNGGEEVVLDENRKVVDPRRLLFGGIARVWYLEGLEESKVLA
jgi:hypothetical protein